MFGQYAEIDRNGNGVLEFAQKFSSSEGEQDGLYWETSVASAPSPLGSLFASDVPEQAYFGYRYQILTAQGEHAPGGRKDYLEQGNLIGGFALIAWPVDYGDTGVMTFMVNQEGNMYETDLGIETKEARTLIDRYDPGPAWEPVVYDVY